MLNGLFIPQFFVFVRSTQEVRKQFHWSVFLLSPRATQGDNNMKAFIAGRRKSSVCHSEYGKLPPKKAAKKKRCLHVMHRLLLCD